MSSTSINSDLNWSKTMPPERPLYNSTFHPVSKGFKSGQSSYFYKQIFCLYVMSVHENMSAYASRWFLSTVLSIKQSKWQYLKEASCRKRCVFPRWHEHAWPDFGKTIIQLHSYRRWFGLCECKLQPWLLISWNHCYHVMLLRGRPMFFLENVLHITQLDTKWLLKLQKLLEPLCQECWWKENTHCRFLTQLILLDVHEWNETWHIP